jgi:hypothetical protein
MAGRISTVDNRAMTLAVIALAIGGTLLVGLVGLTALGQHRRGRGPLAAILAGIFFPVTWMVWYFHDERPYPALHR